MTERLKRVLLPLAEGFEEIEAVTVADILRRAGIDVVIAGLDGERAVAGSRGVRVVPDAALDAVAGQEFDLVVLPGGGGGTERLEKDPRVRDLLGARRRAREPIAAICAAPRALHAFGLVEGARVTCHPTVAGDLAGAEVLAERVVVDGDLVTSRAAGTAMEFAFRLVEILVGAERRDEVNSSVLARL